MLQLSHRQIDSSWAMKKMDVRINLKEMLEMVILYQILTIIHQSISGLGSIGK